MIRQLIISVFLLVLANGLLQGQNTNTLQYSPENQVAYPSFQKILDTLHLKGSILVYDSQRRVYYSNDFQWAETPKIPASTFKIPNTIIALQSGVVESDSTVFKWDGQPKSFKTWEQDLSLANAFKVSCLPCYQKIARKTGAERMRKYLDLLQYPGMQFDDKTIDNFWLKPPSAISQVQQIDFLYRFYYQQLLISERTYSIMKKIFVMENKDGNSLSGKTGWGVIGERNIGWFVGYLATPDNVFFFATNVEPTGDPGKDDFLSNRILASKKALELITSREKH